MSEGLKEHAWKACVGVILLPWVRIPLSPPNLSPALRFVGESGLQALRRCAASGANPTLSAKSFACASIRRREWSSGATPLRGFGRESHSLRQIFRLRFDSSERVVFRRYAAARLRARIPLSPPNLSPALRFVGESGLQALRRCAASGANPTLSAKSSPALRLVGEAPLSLLSRTTVLNGTQRADPTCVEVRGKSLGTR